MQISCIYYKCSRCVEHRAVPIAYSHDVPCCPRPCRRPCQSDSLAPVGPTFGTCQAPPWPFFTLLRSLVYTWHRRQFTGGRRLAHLETRSPGGGSQEASHNNLSGQTPWRKNPPYWPDIWLLFGPVSGSITLVLRLIPERKKKVSSVT